MQEHSTSDESLHSVIQYYQHGWPDSIGKVNKLSEPFWSFREELGYVNGLILKGEKIVIPMSLKQEVLQQIHACHLGIVKCIQRAKDVLFWLWMNTDIYDCVTTCNVCQRRQNANAKEPAITDTAPCPSFPWEYVASDLFT